VGREGTKDRWGMTVQSGFGRWARREEGGGVSCRLWSHPRCSRASWSFRGPRACYTSTRTLATRGGASVHDVVAPPSLLFCSAGNPWLACGGTDAVCTVHLGACNHRRSRRCSRGCGGWVWLLSYSYDRVAPLVEPALEPYEHGKGRAKEATATIADRI
jgi:hypothetical protein